MNKTLTFAKGNAKLNKATLIFSLSAGYTCPSANICLSKANKETGKITDGKGCKFRCYAATTEALFKNVRDSRWKNFELLREAKTVIGMANLLEQGIINRKNIKLVRFNASGDFFNQNYFDAWLLVAKLNPSLIFYGYTKQLPLWINRINEIPANFKIVASYGGLHDGLINVFKLRSAKVVFSEKEARKLKLKLDHDDTHCWKGNTSFGILLHGNQPAGSESGKAWYQIHKFGRGGYKTSYFKHYKDKLVAKALPLKNKFKFIPKKSLCKV